MSLMTRLEDEESITRYVMNTRYPRTVKKDCQSAHDFGEQDTVGLHVKRMGTSIEDDCEDAFGRYLGQHDAGYVVLVTFIDYRPKAIEIFDTLEELKKQWRLD
jgi:hypothetical protein